MKEIKQTSEEQRQLRKRVLSLLVKKDLFKRQEEEYKQEAQEINRIVKTFLEKYGEQKGVIETKKEKVSLTVVEPSTVIWDTEKLFKQLDKQTRKKVFDTQITIKDYDATVDLLKQYGVPPAEFKKLLHVQRAVNEDALNNLFEMGHIQRADIKGCYEVKKGTAYVKLTKTDKKE